MKISLIGALPLLLCLPLSGQALFFDFLSGSCNLDEVQNEIRLVQDALESTAPLPSNATEAAIQATAAASDAAIAATQATAAASDAATAATQATAAASDAVAAKNLAQQALDKATDVETLVMELTDLILDLNAIKVFVTSGAGYIGDLVLEANGLPVPPPTPFTNTEGLEAADFICQYHADLGHLPGTYKAWLSITTAPNVDAIDRLLAISLPPSRKFVRTDGATIANNLADLLDGTLMNAIQFDESGTEVTAEPLQTWTNTRPSGTALSVKDCGNWNYGMSDVQGDTGSITSAGSTWSQGGLAAGCASNRRLYCFEIRN